MHGKIQYPVRVGIFNVVQTKPSQIVLDVVKALMHTSQQKGSSDRPLSLTNNAVYNLPPLFWNNRVIVLLFGLTSE